MHRPHPRRSTIGVAGLLLAAMVLGAAPVAADTPTVAGPDVVSRKVGSYRLRDRADDPAGTCTYMAEVGNDLQDIRSRAPRVFARAGRSSQRVGLRLVVEWFKGGDWTLFRATGWKHRTATPTRDAGFAPLHRSFVSDRLDAVLFYRARLDLRWYGTDGEHVTGTARLWLDHYLSVDPPGADFMSPSTFCGETTG